MAVSPLIAIIGRPNVGKSSLFNRLTGARQAVTHAVAGTTRDANYGQVTWAGKTFTLVDTAGLAYADDDIEIQAQEQVRQAAEVASVIILVVDATTMVTQEDLEAARLARRSGKPVVLALGKIDAAKDVDLSQFASLGINPTIGVSAIHGIGTGDLLDTVASHLPRGSQVEEESILKLALLGRPNVGKSSLVNALVGKQLTVVSEVAGTTRDVSHSNVRYHGQTLQLLDTAGLRRRGRILPGVEKYSSLRTMAAIEEADIALLILDATELSVAGDHHIAGMVAEAGRGLILVVNKWDIAAKDDKTQARLTRRLERDFQFVHWAPVVFVSAETGLNVTKLFELAVQIAERRRQTITTGPLNRVIERLTTAQPPAGAKNRQPNITYATQTGTEPPAFTLFSSHPEFLHFSYKRYLENGLRQEYDFTGTPIRLLFRDKRTSGGKS